MSNLHDQMFRGVMTDPLVARDLFIELLRSNWSRILSIVLKDWCFFVVNWNSVVPKVTPEGGGGGGGGIKFLNLF